MIREIFKKFWAGNSSGLIYHDQKERAYKSLNSTLQTFSDTILCPSAVG